ncbi:MarR family winged helix-turn-helix transcriptional regulator [Caenispirillum salinarum]|uniref:MarR family winged helix-turn-helix transcriptional regulator n=1 Tax=Caenispirillum salinarum TaxID=859058 RepID=UPI0038504753
MLDAYNTIVHMLERLHRHFLDVLRAELRRMNVNDINAVQALLLSNIGDQDVVIRDLKDRGYYHGSNVSYNIKKLTEFGYIHQERAEHDRRATQLRLTDKGMELCHAIRDLQNRLAESLNTDAGATEGELRKADEVLQKLERTWTDYIRYGR